MATRASRCARLPADHRSRLAFAGRHACVVGSDVAGADRRGGLDGAGYSARDRGHRPGRGPRSSPDASSEELAEYLKPTASSPNDGVVLARAREIVGARTAPLDKARAIYDWIVDNTFRRGETRGCGLGNIAFMLETGDLGGKCADINSLYAGLARAAGLPAEGTRIEVWLPRADKSPAVHASPFRPDLIGSQRTAQILLCDDDPDVRGILGEVLQTEGYILHVANGPSALCVASHERPRRAITRDHGDAGARS